MTTDLSRDEEGADWNDFVEAHPWGQLQQSTCWARAKAVEGWTGVRVLWRSEGRLVGGAQVLLKQTRYGRVAFVNKGPLVHPEWSEGPEAVATSLARVQGRERWRFLFLQPPDLGGGLEPALRHTGFREETLLGTVDATLVVDLSAGWETVQSRFRRTTRRNVRQALERGVTVAEGDESDLPDFFRLMAATCVARGVRPNPGSLEALRALWRPFHVRRQTRLWFASHEGRRLAGGLLIALGSQVWFWKKGWDQSQSQLFANGVVSHDGLRWATERGYRSFDFVSLDRDIAEALRSGRELGADLQRRRDFFNLGFGGQARLLPSCLIRCSTPVLRVAYSLATWRTWRRAVRSFAARLGIA